MKRIKSYNEMGYNKAVSSALENKKDAKKLKESLIAFAGYNTIEEIENYLNGKTGFFNSSLSASAMGMESQYKHIVEHFDTIDLEHFTEDFISLTEGYKAELKESFTTYWSKEDTAVIEKTLKLVKSFNELNKSVRQSIVLNRSLEFVFSEQGYSNSLAINNRRQ
jgi:uncharacterized protein YfbU (UPF0304 family)